MQHPLAIRALPAFADNYIWLLSRGDGPGAAAAVVDPGDAGPVIAALRAAPPLRLAVILVTHHHRDHVGGIADLLAAHDVVASDLAVIGPADEPIPHRTRAVADGDRLTVLGTTLDVIAVPGHTRGHLAFHAPEVEALFCGDTLFAGGCGRLFEGTPAQMHGSLQRLAALPPATRVYCAHEYTLSNLRFAAAVEPGNPAVRARLLHTQAQRDRGEATVPSRLADELATNPFLRCTTPDVQAAARQQGAPTDADAVSVLATIRRWKDVFKQDVAR